MKFWERKFHFFFRKLYSKFFCPNSICIFRVCETYCHEICFFKKWQFFYYSWHKLIDMWLLKMDQTILKGNSILNSTTSVVKWISINTGCSHWNWTFFKITIFEYSKLRHPVHFLKRAIKNFEKLFSPSPSIKNYNKSKYIR